ncbi:hypothetical protein ACN23B_28330 (plasmid) [Anabaena sp. FACHB-709]|uniref:Uncharacterized protein n=1 Tax=Trichormus variabilis NIES-23 TaxID=1973479 RepID=A0A1Z4KVI6_ANAVA|nr:MULTISPECIES: hypothetical protein [Nostocaceae]MBD2266893.1 hypothetical protein [Anabaena sp. FACHB-709]MBD2276466.1 hypothetical protein [Nostoc sp. PCC 7120 = FACHB-418]BAB78356.1 all7272 [Nostoc sp. PCC 7120 = FACHB-418]BAY72927.1 hypothetical protein NIES23_57550 [Trichormus variabilis NIES-23]
MTNITYQQLLFKWSTLAPDECLKADHNHKFKVRILPTIEKRNSDNAWRLVTSDNIAWRLANDQSTVLVQLNFVLLTIMHYCAIRHSSISFSFDDQRAIATICNGLRSQPHPHPAIAALEAYIQLLEF